MGTYGCRHTLSDLKNGFMTYRLFRVSPLRLHGNLQADGRVYVGEWVAGMAHGQGIETRPDGTIRHEGRWEHDRPIRNQESVEKTAMKRGGNDVEISEQDVHLKEGSHQNT